MKTFAGAGLLDRMISLRRVIPMPMLGRRASSRYEPSYRESGYQRPILSRLTPLARFILSILAVSLVAMAVVLINKASASQYGNDLLSDRLQASTNPTPTVIQFQLVIYATPIPSGDDLTPVPTESQQIVTPAPTATPDRAPWADKLMKQPDGTLLAPQSIVAKAVADLGAYYAMQRDLSLDNYLAGRDEMLTTYFTGPALEDMRKLEQSRDLYAMNRVGRYSIEVRNFSANGLSAKAAIITRGWVSDVYDVATRQLVAQGRVKKDTLTIMAILFDQVSGHWKFAKVEEVIELNS